MKPRLALSLTGTHLILEVLQPIHGRSLSSFLRSILGLGGTSHDTSHEVKARVELTAPTPQGSLGPRLEQAFAGLKTIYQGSLTGLDVKVGLGLKYSQIGLMTLANVSTTSLTSSTCEAYAQAWVKQMLHLDPATQIVRWEALDDPHKLLISCVDLLAFSALSDFCLQHRLRFASCRPAVLAATAQEASKAATGASSAIGGKTVVWTEAGVDATRASVVQMLRIQGKQISSVWRGWHPPPPAGNSSDETLEGAIRRFQIRNLAQVGDPLARVHWPSISADVNSS